MVDFISNKFNINKGIFEFSPNAQFLATSQNNKLTINQLKNLNIPLTFQTCNLIEGIKWSPDSELICAYNYTQNVLQIFSLFHVKWKCNIKDMKLGFKKVVWSPDSRHILTLSKHNEWITIWSLKDCTISYINRPKNSIIAFSPNGQFLAVIETINELDYILIFSTHTWKLIKKIFCKHVHNIEGIVWSPGSRLFTIWSSMLTDNAIGIYSIEESKWLSYFKPIYIYPNLSGVRKVKWTFSGQFLAVIDLLDTIYILNNISWFPIVEFPLEKQLIHNGFLIYKESISTSDGELRVTRSKFSLIPERPVSISNFHDDTNNSYDLPKSFMKLSNLLSFSPCNSYLANVSPNMPAVLWIYSLIQLELHSVLIFEKPITHFCWSPWETRLIISTGSTYITHWSPLTRVSCLDMPITGIGQSVVKKSIWRPSGDVLALASDMKLTLVNINSEVMQ